MYGEVSFFFVYLKFTMEKWDRHGCRSFLKLVYIYADLMHTERDANNIKDQKR